ncbi:MAG: GGDEF domain-containing protein [Proteobacteria bacterium]|nr:GGDEF domain-containing protein [Pseudomonadota bacterium]
MMKKTTNSRLRRWLPAAAALLLVAGAANGAAPEDALRLLQRADSIKSTHHPEFVGILNSLNARAAQLSVAQREYLSYLTAWNAVINGDNETATGMLKRLILQAHDVTLQFRARSTLMNQEELTRNYDEAYLELDRLVQLLPRVADKGAREQALLNASQLYRAVGQTDLSLRYAQMLMDENYAGRGTCRGGQQKVAALFESARQQSVDADVRAITAACVEKGDLLYANDINMHVARLYISQNKLDEAITLLKDHYDEVVRSQYPRMLAEFDALLADAYRRKGLAVLAEKFASDSVTHSGQGHYPATMARALGVLYELAKKQGDFRLALAFHEQFTAADKGSLDEVSARQLAYEKVVHENIADKLQLAALNEQKQVLQLQKELAAKAVENSRLYIALLLTILVFIGLWAYRVKRSQLHFMSVARLDGLTGISNRPHFIGGAESALEHGRRTRQELCIVLFDLDHFKSVNDRHGHAMGDYVLQQTVAMCRQLLGAEDLFGRFGGEEFSILMPGCGLAEASARAEQLRRAIAQIVASSGGTESPVSASFGLASTAASGSELRQLLAHADAALYQAKRTGRNRVVIYDSGIVLDETAVAELVEQPTPEMPPPRSKAG